MAEGDHQELTLGLAVGPLRLGVGDFVDERDVLAFLEVEFLSLAAGGHGIAVFAREVAHQVVDRADPEVLLQLGSGLVAEEKGQPVVQRGHGHSTPISSESPRWPV